MALPMNLRRTAGGDAARVRGVMSWISDRSPHAFVPDGPAANGRGELYFPQPGLEDQYGGELGGVGLGPIDALASLARTTVFSGLVLGAVFGASLGSKGRRMRGAGVGALLGGLTGFLTAVFGAQTAMLAAQAALAEQAIATAAVKRTA